VVKTRCYQTLFVEFNFAEKECLILIISRIVGYLIVLFSAILKVPQIMIILNGKSAKGIDILMFQLELIGFYTTSSYSIYNGFAFSTYGENILISIQNVIIIYLIYKYTTGVDYKFYSFNGVLLLYFYAMAAGIIPVDIMKILQGSTILIFIASKIPQIYTTFKIKDASKLAFSTFFLSLVGSLVRVFTTLTEVDDKVVLLGYIIGAILNGILSAQIIMYGAPKETKDTPKKENQKKKDDTKETKDTPNKENQKKKDDTKETKDTPKKENQKKKDDTKEKIKKETKNE